MGVNEYISQMDYRAWGAAKQVSYGNNLTTKNAFNNRLLISRYEGLQGATTKFGANYQYYEDGLTKYSQDLTDNRMDRSYKYDQMARVIEAKSGAEARGEPNTDNRPYRQTFGYDVWGNPTGRGSRHWSQDFNVAETYSNNRVTGYSYDADGRYTGHLESCGMQCSITYTNQYDAAGLGTFSREHEEEGTPLLLQEDRTRSFDGDGRMVREEIFNTCQTCVPQPLNTQIYYYIRSSLLGGEVFATANNQGNQLWGFAYGDGGLIGSKAFDAQQGATVFGWKMETPTGSSELTTYSDFGTTGNVSRVEKDPVGANMGLEDPYIGGAGINNNDESGDLTSRYSSAKYWGRCYLDGIRVRCGLFVAEIGVRAPNETAKRVIWDGKKTRAFFRAYGDGYAGYVPVNGRYLGRGDVGYTTFPDPRHRKHRLNDTDLSELNQTGNNEQFLRYVGDDPLPDISQFAGKGGIVILRPARSPYQQKRFEECLAPHIEKYVNAVDNINVKSEIDYNTQRNSYWLKSFSAATALSLTSSNKLSELLENPKQIRVRYTPLTGSLSRVGLVISFSAFTGEYIITRLNTLEKEAEDFVKETKNFGIEYDKCASQFPYDWVRQPTFSEYFYDNRPKPLNPFPNNPFLPPISIGDYFQISP
jgi:hypothetical protein